MIIQWMGGDLLRKLNKTNSNLVPCTYYKNHESPFTYLCEDVQRKAKRENIIKPKYRNHKPEKNKINLQYGLKFYNKIGLEQLHKPIWFIDFLMVYILSSQTLY